MFLEEKIEGKKGLVFALSSFKKYEKYTLKNTGFCEGTSGDTFRSTGGITDSELFSGAGSARDTGFKREEKWNAS